MYDMKRQSQLLILILIIISNLLIYSLLLPYLQKMANSHVGDNVLWSIFLSVFSILILSRGVYYLIKKKDYMAFTLFIMFAATLLYWGYRFYFLECLGCSTSG